MKKTNKRYVFRYTRSAKTLSDLMKKVHVVNKNPVTDLRLMNKDKINTYLKLEYQNSSNSFKNRPAEICVSDAFKNGYSKIFADTSGNLGLAISLLAKKKKIFTEIILNNRNYVKKDDLKKNSSVLTYRDNQPTLLSRILSVICSLFGVWDLWWFLNNKKLFEQKSKEGYYLAQPSIFVNPKSLIGYSNISWEIYKQLNKKAPDYLITPVVNSDNAIGQWLGYYALYKEKKIYKIPSFILVEAKKRIKHFNYPDAWKIIRKISEVRVIEVDEKDEKLYKRYLRKNYNIVVENISAGVFAVYNNLLKKNYFNKLSNVVLVLSGSNV